MASTRVVIRVDGVERQLFKIEQASDGHLTLLFTSLTARLSDSTRAVNSVKLSAHNSEQSKKPGNHIHGQIVEKGGKRTDYHGFVHLNDGDLLAPLMVAACPIFERNDHKLKPNKKDRIIQLLAYQTSKTTMFYVPVLMRPGFNPPHPEGWNVAVVDFDQYSLAIYSAFLEAPSPAMQLISFRSSRAPLEDREPIDNRDEVTINVNTRENLDQEMKWIVVQLAKALLASRGMAKSPEWSEDFFTEVIGGGMSRWPLDQSDDDKQYGINRKAFDNVDDMIAANRFREVERTATSSESGISGTGGTDEPGENSK